MSQLQINSQGELKHLLTIDGLSKKLLTELLDSAEHFATVGERAIKKVPLLQGRTIVNLFFEPSTRTRSTFELAAKRLSADVLNIQASTSSTTKGETLLDTLATIQAMRVDMFVIRHSASGAAHFFAQHAAEGVGILNAGDGRHAHPTQALLDMFTLRRHRPDFSKLVVTIIGDILHSRVARSDIHALRILGAKEIRVAAPRSLIPVGVENLGVKVFNDVDAALEGSDVAMLLRMQNERMSGQFISGSSEFHRRFGMTQNRLNRMNKDALIMHPGPFNRGVEIQGNLAYGDRSLILQQVENGIAVRMAAMATILGNSERRHEH